MSSSGKTSFSDNSLPHEPSGDCDIGQACPNDTNSVEPIGYYEIQSAIFIFLMKIINGLMIEKIIYDGYNRHYGDKDKYYLLKNDTEIEDYNYPRYVTNTLLKTVAGFVNNGIDINNNRYDRNYDPYDPEYVEPKERRVYVTDKLYSYLCDKMSESYHNIGNLEEGLLDHIVVISETTHNRLYGTTMSNIKWIITKMEDKTGKSTSDRFNKTRADFKKIIENIPKTNICGLNNWIKILIEKNRCKYCKIYYESYFVPVYEEYFYRWVYRKWYSDFLRNPETKLGKRIIHNDFQRLESSLEKS